MSIWNKVLLGFIALAAIAFYVLGARALKTHKVWREALAKHEKKLREVLNEEDKIRGVTAGEKQEEQNLREARIELHKLQLGRGRVWNEFKPQQVEDTKDDSGAPSVKVLLSSEGTKAHQIAPKMILWCFEKKDLADQGAFLGQFTVSNVGDKSLELVPTEVIVDQKPVAWQTDWQLERLKASPGRGAWLLYEVLPADEHEIFAKVKNLEKMLPEGSVAEYLEDGKEAATGSKESSKHERKLRDYATLFHSYQARHAILVEDTQVINRDTASANATIELTKKLIADYDKMLSDLDRELTREKGERDLISAHVKALEAKVADLKRKTEDLAKGNQARAAEIERLQREAATRVDVQTRKMARAAPTP
jgi:hypothetical protein